MSRYIDADVLRHDIIYHANAQYYKGNHDKEEAFTYCLYLIDCMPTSDVVERKQGKWIIEEEGAYSNSLYTAYCSNCRHYVNWFEHEYEKTVIRELPDYCSNCGSDMRKILPKL